MKRKIREGRVKVALLAAIMLIFTVIPAAAFADTGVTVYVTVKNETFPQGSDKGQGVSPWSGSLISDYAVTLTAGQSMQDAVEKACRENSKSLSAYPGYIYGVEGLVDGYGNGQPNGGGSSGWMTALNGWFLDVGADTITVGGSAGRDLQNGDRILLAYSCNGGADVGNDWSATDKTLKALTFDKGTLSPKLNEADDGEYILTVPHGTKSLVLSAVPNHSEKFIALMSTDGGTTFSRPGKVAVEDGTILKVYSGTSTDILEPDNQYATGSRIYTITVAEEEDTAAGEEPADKDQKDKKTGSTGEKTKEHSPQTGDENMALEMMILILLGSVSVLTIIGRRVYKK